MTDQTFLSGISDEVVAAFKASGEFDAQWYVHEYPDVAKSGIEPVRHFLWIGRRLGRRPNGAASPHVNEMSLDASFQAKQPDGSANSPDHGYAQEGSDLRLIDKARQLLFRQSDGAEDSVHKVVSEHFDNDFYLNKYPDILAAGVDPVRHFLTNGWHENRDPSATFSTTFYLENNPDVVAAGVNPYFHFLTAGKTEGRKATPVSDYADWLERNDKITQDDISVMRRTALGWAHRPTFSVIMPVYNTPEELLREALDSVVAQAYPHWELCVADDCSPAAHVRRILDEYAAKDKRIKIIYRVQNGHISEASNSALSIATGQWYALMDHDDLLPPHALYCMAHAIEHNPDIKLIYSDEDKINQAGQREGAYFKPDFNLELFRSQNMISHFGVYHRSLIDQVGGFRSEFNGSQDYDLALRCIEVLRPEQIHHVPRVLYHWRIVEGSTALSADEKPYAMIAGERALNEHFGRLGIKATSELIGYGYRTRHQLETNPLVSIIIPTRNAMDLVKQCIDSLLLKTTYENYELVLVDNGSDDPEALAYFKALQTNSRIKVIRDDRPFNYSAINNNAVKYCAGDLLVLLNNDTEVISEDWLETMIGYAIQPNVGAVGAKLLYPDGTVQHAGVVLGLAGSAGHVHVNCPGNDPGYFGRLSLTSEFSAVTAACLAVRKELFLAVGGLNEDDLTVAFNDVDFCLKLRQRGFRNIHTPFAQLYHHESATRGHEAESAMKKARFERECAYLKKTWGDFISNDPAYNPNLTLQAPNFTLASNPRLTKIW